ncbi:hypothetical protein [Evansella halocellulosilytica]|uniref:hypothetical protein n=1 Tax=Evansella halocellulosilytica TaxID=2011013 RepID=UPI000BB7DEC8|nr:hypothetical protein [Evansella halocellulosilytica]
MKTNAVIFTSYNGITSILPTNLRSVPVFQIGLDRQSIPLTSEHLALYFKQYDHVILFKTNHTGDHLIQGTHSHVSGFLTLLFYTFARKFKKKLYYVNDRQQLVEITNGDGAPFRKLASLTDKKKMYTPHTHTVTSIQKIKVKNDLTAEQMSKQYFSWLELFTKLIYIDESDGEYSFKVRFAQTALLQLKENSAFRHDPLTAEFIINGGVLNKDRSLTMKNGRFWFLLSPDRSNLYTALVHFRPSLPWPVYLRSQSPIHAFVMKRFAQSNKTIV